MKNPSITIRTPRSTLQKHHAQSKLNAVGIGKVVYFSTETVEGKSARVWISKPQARWLSRWLRDNFGD